MGLRPLACWGCGFECGREHGGLFLVNVVCCQVEASASGWSLIQRGPTECGVSNSVITKPRKGKPWREIGSKRSRKKKLRSVLLHDKLRILLRRWEVLLGQGVAVTCSIMLEICYGFTWVWVHAVLCKRVSFLSWRAWLWFCCTNLNYCR